MWEEVAFRKLYSAGVLLCLFINQILQYIKIANKNSDRVYFNQID